MKNDLYENLKDIFNSILPEYGYSVRTNQIELANHILMSMQNRQLALCEAGVGSGKTHAYIIAAILHTCNNPDFELIRQTYPADRDYFKTTKMPIVISTSSIQLQRAITLEYIPRISKILLEHNIITEPLTYVVRKGKEHYICDRRLSDYLSTADMTDETITILENLKSADFKKIDLDSANLSPYIKRRINVPDWCNVFCPRYEKCRYSMLLVFQRNNIHNFQVCNHNYFFADLLKRKQGQRPLIPHYQGVIFDESHKLLDAARQIYGFTLSKRELTRLIEVVHMLFRFNISATPYELCEIIKKTKKYIFKMLDESVSGNEEENHCTFSLTNSLSTLIKSLLINLTRLSKHIENANIKPYQSNLSLYVSNTLNSLIERLDMLSKPCDHILWLDVTNNTGNIIINAIPKQLNNLLYHDFFMKHIPVVLTSGTLTAAGSFDRFKRDLGIDRIVNERVTEVSFESPFDYINNCLIYLAADLPFPDPKDSNYITAVSERIDKLIKATHGHTLILFTSYRVMELVYDKLKIALTYPLIKVGKGVLNAIETFKKSGNGVLFSAGSCWEGVDMPGDILSSLIIVKLPFPTPDPVSEYERTLYDNERSFMNEVLIPQMLIKLKQGAGRLIRNETDTGVISVLDSRLRKGGHYREDVIKTLPKCLMTSDIKEIERFIKRIKPKAYFEENK